MKRAAIKIDRIKSPRIKSFLLFSPDGCKWRRFPLCGAHRIRVQYSLNPSLERHPVFIYQEFYT